MVKNPPCNAGNVGSIPAGGTKIPYAAGQLSPRAITRESMCHNYRAHELWIPHATTREKPTNCNEEPACRNERSCVLQLRPDATKKKKKKIYIYIYKYIIPMAFFKEIEQTILKLVWNYKRLQIAPAILRKERKARDIMFPDFKLLQL